MRAMIIVLENTCSEYNSRLLQEALPLQKKIVMRRNASGRLQRYPMRGAIYKSSQLLTQPALILNADEDIYLVGHSGTDKAVALSGFDPNALAMCLVSMLNFCKCQFNMPRIYLICCRAGQYNMSAAGSYVKRFHVALIERLNINPLLSFNMPSTLPTVFGPKCRVIVDHKGALRQCHDKKRFQEKYNDPRCDALTFNCWVTKNFPLMDSTQWCAVGPKTPMSLLLGYSSWFVSSNKRARVNQDVSPEKARDRDAYCSLVA